MKKKEATVEKQRYTCPNPSCGKVFNSPLKVENVSSKSIQVYDACPFCLVAITTDENPRHEEEDAAASDERATWLRETLPEPSPNPHTCAHHLGYLSERSTKENIPEGCITCENIVQCILKKVTG